MIGPHVHMGPIKTQFLEIIGTPVDNHHWKPVSLGIDFEKLRQDVPEDDLVKVHYL